MMSTMVQSSNGGEAPAPMPTIGLVGIGGLTSHLGRLELAWFLLVFFGAMPLGFLDLRWLVYAAESMAGVTVFSGVLDNVASVASVRYLAFGIALAIGLWQTRWRSGRWSIVLRALLAYTLWAMASVVWSVSPVLGVIKALSLIATVLVAGALADQPEGHARLVRVTQRAVVMVLMIAVGVAVALPEYGLDPHGDWYPRLGGQLVHPNELAECVGLLLILTLGWPGDRKAWTRWALAIASVMVVAATQSRTTMLALGVAGAVWLMARAQPITRALFVGLAALAILALGLSELDGQGLLRYLGRGSAEDVGETIAQRVELWEYGLKQSLGSLLVGQGFAVGSRIVLGPAFWWRPMHAHNLPLEILLNLGLVGCLIGGLVVLLATRSLLRLARGDGDPGRRGAVGLTLLAFVCALGVTERSFGGELSSAVIGFVLAVAIASLRVDVPPVADEPRVARVDGMPTHLGRTAPA